MSAKSLLRAHSRGSFSRLVFESEHNNGGGDDSRSLLFRFCQLMVISFRLVTPLSYMMLISLLFFCPSTAIFGGDISYRIVVTWLILEAVFFPYYLYLFTSLNNQKATLQHYSLTKESRMKLAYNCVQAMKLGVPRNSALNTSNDECDPEALHIRHVIEGWFLNEPIENIYRDNMLSWVGWAFVGEDLKDMTEDERNQADEILRYFENEAKHEFKHGCNKELCPARLTLDPIFATQRPFFFYSTIYSINIIAHIILFFLGFRKLQKCSSKSQSIYHRKGKPKQRNNDLDGTEATSDEAHPVVFVHGIGIGLTHYLGLIFNLPSEVDVFLVEWPHVAMQMATRPPTIDESIDSILCALDTFHHKRATFVAHSLGTTAVSWMLHHAEGCRRVAATVLIDPVVFLLCDPTVATSFVYKEPTTTIQFLMHFYVSRELFIANALSRHFNWSQNILFVEDLSAVDSGDEYAYTKPEVALHSSHHVSGSEVERNPVTQHLLPLCKAGVVPQLRLNHSIFMSSQDHIVPIAAVERYFQRKMKEGNTCFEVVMFDGQHGEMFIYPKWMAILSSRIRERCGLETDKQRRLSEPPSY